MPVWWLIDVKFSRHAAKQSVQLNRRNGTNINEMLGEVIYTSQMKDNAAKCKMLPKSSYLEVIPMAPFVCVQGTAAGS